MNRPYITVEDFFTVLSKDIEEALTTGTDAIKNAYTCPSFPPANVYTKEDKTLVYEFAVAGYNKEDVSIEFDSNYMVLTLKAPKEDVTIGHRIYHRLKVVDSVQRYIVPNDKYVYAETKADMKDGILLVTIPSKEPQKVKINL